MTDQSSPNQNQSDEIDLSVVFDKIKSLFKSLLLGVVMIFQFFWNHKIRLAILLIIGFGLQFLFLAQTEKIYKNEFFVRTNFSSTEYLYSKVNSINAKLESEDTLYLLQIFGEEYERVDELEVVPVVDIYDLVNKSENNREVFTLLLNEYGDISFLEEEININEYTTHKIKIFIKGINDNQAISNNLYNFLSDNSYYNDLRKSTLINYREQLEQNKIIRAQIDSIIKSQKENQRVPNIDNNAISFTGSQDLKELLNQKRELLDDDLRLRNGLTSNENVLKIIDSSFGILSEERNHSVFVIPFLLLGIYLIVFTFKFLDKKAKRFISLNTQ